MNTQAITVLPGTYYLGDPCYCFREHSKWLSILEETNYFELPLLGFGDRFAFAFNTAYGDGMYHDQHGREYPVDAGLIGLVPVEMADCTPTGVQKIVFEEAQKCYEENGTLHFGEITIETGVLQEEDGDEEEN